MFVYNLKLNRNGLCKFIFIVIIFAVLVLLGIVSYRLYKASFKVDDNISPDEYIELSNENYANVLKEVHSDIDTYVGQKIKYSGFIYRVYDLENNQFVLARNMIISSDMQTVIVGFLCNYDKAIYLKDNTWVEIEATITKGTYHGDMPILKVESIKEINKPDNEYVSPPNEEYIPTSVIL